MTAIISCWTDNKSQIQTNNQKTTEKLSSHRPSDMAEKYFKALQKRRVKIVWWTFHEHKKLSPTLLISPNSAQRENFPTDIGRKVSYSSKSLRLVACTFSTCIHVDAVWAIESMSPLTKNEFEFREISTRRRVRRSSPSLAAQQRVNSMSQKSELCR